MLSQALKCHFRWGLRPSTLQVVWPLRAFLTEAYSATQSPGEGAPSRNSRKQDLKDRSQEQVQVRLVELVEIDLAPGSLADLAKRDLAQAADLAQHLGDLARAGHVDGLIARVDELAARGQARDLGRDHPGRPLDRERDAPS